MKNAIFVAGTIATLCQGVLSHGSEGYLSASRTDEHVWIPRTNLNVPRSDASATTVDSTIYVMGGCGTNEFISDLGFPDCTDILNSVEEFSPLKNEAVLATGAMPSPRFRHVALANSQKKIFVMGGLQNGTHAVDTVDIYDTTTMQWETAANKLPARLGDGCGFEFNDKVYYAGGYLVEENYTAVGTVFEFDTSTGEFTTLTEELNVPRGDAAAVVLDGFAYVYGGFDGEFSPLSSIERLNLNEPEAGWTLVSELSSNPRGDAAIATLHEKIVILGGEGKDANSNSFPRRTVEVYQPGFGWYSGGEMYVARFRFPAATFGDSVFVFGGQGFAQQDGSLDISDRIDEYSESPSVNQLAPIELHGGGTTNPSKFFWKTMEKFESGSRTPLFMTYRAIGSGAGQQEFLGTENFEAANDFGSGDIPLSKSRYTELTNNGHGMIHVPFTVGAIGVFVNIPGLGENQVKLSPCAAAKVFMTEITRWNDDELVADNEFLRDIDQPIQVFHRVLSSSSTFGIASFLKESCESVWTLGASSVVAWPDSTNGVYGSDEVAKGLISTEFSIGYLDAGHGHSLSLQEVALKNSQGQFTDSKTGKVGELVEAASASFPDPTGDWSDVSLVNSDVDQAFPIVMLSYFYVRTDQTGKGETASLLRAFIEYSLTKEAQEILEKEFLFFQLPQSVLDAGIQSLEDNLVMPHQAIEFSFETSTLPNVGSGKFVISGKRKTFGSYERGLLRTRISQLEAELMASQVQVAEVKALVEGGGVSGTSGNNDGVGIAALIIAILALLVGLYGASRTRSISKKEVPLADDFHSRNNSADPIRGVEMNQV